MGRFMNRYLYGKAGQGDFKKSDLPTTRWQLFWQMLRIRLNGLTRLNLMTCLAFIPLIAVLFSFTIKILYYTSNLSQYLESNQIISYDEQGNATVDAQATEVYGAEVEGIRSSLEGKEVSALYLEFNLIYSRFLMNIDAFRLGGFWEGFTSSMLLLLLPCIMITGPVQAGMAHICRNWARDEHAFIWSDFKDAVKENWKQGLGISTLTGLLVFFIPTALWYYWGMGQGANASLLWYVPIGILLCLSLIWFLGLTFFYPVMVGYNVTFRQLVKNGLSLAAARLPMVFGIRLLNALPVIIGYLVLRNFPNTFMYVLLILSGYYLLFGNAFARFCHASYANGVFDKYINSKIPGTTVNRGLNTETDEDDEEDETAEEKSDK